MAKLKQRNKIQGKTKALINFVIGFFFLIIVWYFSVRYQRSFEYNIKQLEILKQQVDQNLNLVYHFDTSQIKQKNVNLQENIVETIEKIFQKSNTPRIYYTEQKFETQKKADYANFLVKIECLLENQEEKLKFNKINNEYNLNQIQIFTDCDENKIKRKEVQELKRILSFLNEDLLDFNYSYYDELNIFDFYSYGFQNYPKELKQLQIVIKEATLRLAQNLNILGQNIRINFKDFLYGEYDELDQLFLNESKKEILVKQSDLQEQIIKKNILFAQKHNRINYKHYHELETLLIAQNIITIQENKQQNQEKKTKKKEEIKQKNQQINQKIHILDESQEKFDQFVIDQYAFQVYNLDENQSQIIIPIMNILYDFYEVSDFIQLANNVQELNFLNQIDNELINAYFHKREVMYRLGVFIHNIKTLNFQYEQPENFYYTYDNVKEINKWIEQGLEVLKNINNQKQFIKIVQDMENLNELDSVGLIEAFTLEYTRGVYWPLTFPLLFPFIEYIIKVIKQQKQKRKDKSNEKSKIE